MATELACITSMSNTVSIGGHLMRSWYVFFLATISSITTIRLPPMSYPRFALRDGQLEYYPPQQSRTTRLRDHVLAHSNIAVTLGDAIRGHKGLLALARNNGFVSWAPTQGLSQQQRSEVLAIARLQLRGMSEHLAARHVRLFVLVIPDPHRVQDLTRGHLNPDFAGTAPQDRAFLERGLLTILETEGIPHEYPRAYSLIRSDRDIPCISRTSVTLPPEGQRQVAEVLENPAKSNNPVEDTRGQPRRFSLGLGSRIFGISLTDWRPQGGASTNV